MRMLGTGWAVAGIALAMLAATACASGSSSSVLGTGEVGQVTVQLGAGSGTAPASFLTTLLGQSGGTGVATILTANPEANSETSPVVSATITVSSVRVHGIDGTWHDLSSQLAGPLDLMSVLGAGLPIAAGTLPAGSYDEIEITITSASLSLLDGTSLVVTLPSGGAVAAVPVAFDVVDGQGTTVALRFDVEKSFMAIGGGIGLEPEIEVEGVE